MSMTSVISTLKTSFSVNRFNLWNNGVEEAVSAVTLAYSTPVYLGFILLLLDLVLKHKTYEVV